MEAVFEKKELTIADLKRSNVPENFWYVTIAGMPKDYAFSKKILSFYSKMEQFLDDGIGLYLFSTENLTGKTSIAISLLKRALRLRRTAFFSEAGSLKNALTKQETFDENMLLDKRIREVDLLVIDDLGKEYRTSSGYAETTFENIFRDRTQTKKSIIVTGNLSPADISKIYSPSLAALFKGYLIPVQVSGYNWAEKRQAELKKIL